MTTINNTAATAELTIGELFDVSRLEQVFSNEDELDRVREISLLKLRAKALKCEKEFADVIKAYEKQLRADEAEERRTIPKAKPFDKISTLADGFILGNWQIDRTGVFQEKLAGKGNAAELVKEYASPIPIVPCSIIENIDSGTEKIELKFLKYGRWKNIICERSTTASKNKILELANKGVEVNSEGAAKLVRYISDFVAWNMDKLPRKKAKSSLGWSGKDFLPYTDEIIFDGEDANRALYNSICSKGTVEEWASFMEPLRKNLIFRLCMAAAFASPLIALVGENPFVFHLWGGTGAGKTVALMSAMSIWGNPAPGKMVRTMNMTQNSMLSTAAFLNSIPFAGDELQTIKSQWQNYDQLIMRVTEGIDRARMSYDKVNDVKSWKCSFLFSGEEPCTKQASGGGAKNRVIEIECFGKLVENGNETANFVTEHYGNAGRLFVEAVSQIDIGELYREKFEKIIRTCETTDKQAGAMALMLVADDIASAMFWKSESIIQIHDVKKHLKSASEVDNSERAFAYIIDVIAKNENNFRADSKEIWGKINDHDNAIYINKTVLTDILSTAGFDFDAVKSKWLGSGHIIPNSQGRFAHNNQCYGVKAAYIKLCLAGDTEAPPQENLPF